MSSSTGIKLAKKQLRSRVQSRLQTVSQDSLFAQSQLILANLLQLPIFQDAQNVAVFMNMPDSEVKTMPVIAKCYEVGKKVYLPRCNMVQVPNRKKNYLSMLHVPMLQDVANLTPQGKYHLLEPVEGEDALDTGELDLMLIPGVAFNANLERLGHGAGFYDEFLSTFYKKWSRLPYLIGLSLDEQIVSEGEIPTEVHDYKLDKVVTGTRVFSATTLSPLSSRAR